MTRAKTMLLQLYNGNHTDIEAYMVDGQLYATKTSIALIMHVNERMVSKWVSEGLTTIGDNSIKLIPVDEARMFYVNKREKVEINSVLDNIQDDGDSLEPFLLKKMTSSNLKIILDIEKVQKLRHERQKAGADADIKILQSEKERIEFEIYKKTLIRKEAVNDYIEKSQIRLASAIMKSIENTKTKTKKFIKSMVTEEHQSKIDKHLESFVEHLTKDIKRNLENE